MPRLIKYNTVLLAADATLDYRDMYVEGLFVASGACATITVPAPDYDAFLIGLTFRILNNTASAVTVSCTNGFAQSGDSMSIASAESIEYECVDDGAGGYLWSVIGAASAATAELIQDTAGAMFTGNTETGITMTYQDTDGTIDAVVTYGTAAATACQGNDARLPTAAEKAAFPWAEATALTGGAAGALDALVTAGAATVGAEEVIVTLGAAPNQTFARYRFEKTGVAAESSPDVIRPDDFATDGQGNWNLVLFSGTALPYGTAADTVCVGNDGRLPTAGEKTALAALAGSLNWQDYAPTLGTFPGVVDSTVARYQRVGNAVSGYVDVRGADGDGVVPASITLPVAPVDGNCRVPCKGYYKIGAAAKVDIDAEIDAETSLKIIFNSAVALTNATAWEVQVHFGPYEVSA